MFYSQVGYSRQENLETFMRGLTSKVTSTREIRDCHPNPLKMITDMFEDTSQKADNFPEDGILERAFLEANMYNMYMCSIQ